MHTADSSPGRDAQALESGNIPSAETLTPEMRHLLSRITAAIEHKPVEDGIAHPAEPWLALLLQHGSATTLYGEMFERQPRVSSVASLVRLLGRRKPADPGARQQILRSALASPSTEIRDAAVQAAELWEDRNAFEILRHHVERSPWLADHIGRVLKQAAALPVPEPVRAPVWP